MRRKRCKVKCSEVREGARWHADQCSETRSVITENVYKCVCVSFECSWHCEWLMSGCYTPVCQRKMPSVTSRVRTVIKGYFYWEQGRRTHWQYLSGISLSVSRINSQYTNLWHSNSRCPLSG